MCQKEGLSSALWRTTSKHFQNKEMSTQVEAS